MNMVCPKCGGHLAAGGLPHCDPKRRADRMPCGWIKHRSCGAVVDPRRGRFIEGPKV